MIPFHTILARYDARRNAQRHTVAPGFSLAPHAPAGSGRYVRRLLLLAVLVVTASPVRSRLTRALVLLGILLTYGASPAWATIALVNHKAAFATTTTTTTAAVDMTGATLLVVGAAGDTSGATFTFSDSSSNTWTKGTLLNDSSEPAALQLAYAVNPTVTASQTFTVQASAGSVVVMALGFSGTLTTASVFDAQNTHTTLHATTTGTPGSVTPAQSGEVFVTFTTNQDAPSAISIGSSFNITDSSTSSSFNVGSAAYLVNSGSSAQNPTWTYTGNANTNDILAVQAAFKPSGGAPAPAGVNKRQKLEKLGVGQ